MTAPAQSGVIIGNGSEVLGAAALFLYEQGRRHVA